MGVACVALPLVASILDLFRSPERSRRPVCAANLKGVATACLVYAEEHDGELPSSLDSLLQGGAKAYLQPKQLTCPKGHRPYIYIGSQRNTWDPRNIVAYEPLENHAGKGCYVSYLDGHSIWKTPQGLREELEQTMASIAYSRAAAATTPAAASEPARDHP